MMDVVLQVTGSWVCKELLSLLLQYPGGVSEAVALTELSERWQEQVLWPSFGQPHALMRHCTKHHVILNET